MPQKVVTDAKGLRTFKNELSLPDGSLVVANNIVIDRDNIIESRRGIKVYSDEFGIFTDRAKQLMTYKNRLLVHFNNKVAFDNGVGGFNELVGTYSELSDGLRIKSIEANSNFYFTTSSGIQKLSLTSPTQYSSASQIVVNAGGPKALDGQGEVNTATAGFFSTQTAIAYRITWGYVDANDNFIEGSPSERIIVRNLSSSDTRTVFLTFTIPEEVLNDSKYFYRVYRSPMINDSVSPGLAVPEDELQLCFEDSPTSTDFTNGYVYVEDITPEDYRQGGEYLYTNPSTGSGILSSNERPPVAKDIASYRGSIFYSNTKTRHQKNLSIISTALLTNGDQIILGNVVYGDITFTLGATESISTRQVLLATGGSVSQNIDDTARSLVRVVNRSLCPVYAYYISGLDDVPGLILFESRTLDDVPFYIKTNIGVNPTAFHPKLPTTNTELSTNQIAENRLYFSKYGQPEAVPSLNYFDIGPKDSPIVRIAALRDSLFIFKSEGIYRLSGNDASNFTVSLVDSSAIITAPDSLSVLNNEIYFLSTQECVKVSESGQPSVISRDIERDFLIPSTYPNTNKVSFGISYETDRSYLIFLPTYKNDTVSTQCYRYNTFTNTWVRWEVSKTCGIVNTFDDKLYLGASDLNQIEVERKDYERTDYADREYTNIIQSNTVVGNTLSLSNLTNVAKNDVIYQEVYITISRFNRVLLKLDMDVGLNDTNYYETLQVSQGTLMNNALAALVTKIALDDTTQTYSTTSGTNNFDIIKTEFNRLMDELNASSQVFFSNYTKYDNTIPYESIISDITPVGNKATLVSEVPFITGEVTIFKAIPTEVVYSPQTLGDPSLQKQFREATLMFDSFNFNSCAMGFKTDLSGNFKDTEFLGDNVGDFGVGLFGETSFGGEASEKPFRTYVPRDKQRARFIKIRFLHNAARENFLLTGYSLTYNSSVTERAYRR